MYNLLRSGPIRSLLARHLHCCVYRMRYSHVFFPPKSGTPSGHAAGVRPVGRRSSLCPGVGVGSLCIPTHVSLRLCAVLPVYASQRVSTLSLFWCRHIDYPGRVYAQSLFFLLITVLYPCRRFDVKHGGVDASLPGLPQKAVRVVEMTTLFSSYIRFGREPQTISLDGILHDDCVGISFTLESVPSTAVGGTCGQRQGRL